MMEQRPALLLVEDDAALRDTLAYNLRQEGYETLTAGDGVTALEIARSHPVGLVILDVMLPRLDGLETLRQLRARPETARVPVLMLTARVEESDIVAGLELGADDYVTKPFSWNEVRARIRALLRRGATTTPGASEQPLSEPLVAGDLTLDLDRREVRKDEQVIELPARLFDLLAYLARHRGIVITRGRLLERVWGYEDAGDTRTVDVHVRWLREKIEDDPANPRLILTVRGVGYRLKD